MRKQMTVQIISPGVTEMSGSAPRPTPSARPIALPAFVTSPFNAASTWVIAVFLLVFRLDRRADVDGGQGSEDERLDGDDDHDLEDVEDRGHRDDEHGQDHGFEDEHQADEGQDQDVAREHVREEPDAERDEAHELPEDLERDDQGEQRLRLFGNP